MKADNKMQEKILKYHQMVRDGKDTSAIKAEIDAYTQQYLDETNLKVNAIVAEKKDIKQSIDEKRVKKVSIRKDYNRLIELYRKTKELSDEISKYKKILRGKK